MNSKTAVSHTYWDNLEAFLGFDPIILAIGLSAIITVVGLYQSSQGKITVFANYTDVLFTMLAPIVLLAVLLVTSDNKSHDKDALLYSGLAFSALLFLLVTKATFAYNRGFGGFAAALISKFTMTIFYILAMIFIISKHDGRRKQYELESVYEARRRREKVQTAVSAVAATGIFAVILGKFGLRQTGFVSLADYFHGRGQAPAENN